MTDRTWTGNVNNNARNPGNWDPTGAPQPGDNLLLPSGSTINVTDDDLHGDPLVVSAANFSPPPTNINLSHHAQVLFEMSELFPGCDCHCECQRNRLSGCSPRNRR